MLQTNGYLFKRFFQMLRASAAVAQLLLASVVAAQEPLQQSAAPALQPTPVPCEGGSTPLAATWSLAKAAFQASLLSATQSQQTFQAEVVALRPSRCATQSSFVNLIAGYDAKQQSGKPGSIVNRTGDLRLQQLFFMHAATNYVAINADSYHNSSLGMYFQQAIGVGGGRIFQRDQTPNVAPPMTIEIDADVRAIHQRFYGAHDDDLIGTLLSVRASSPLKSARLTVALAGLPVLNKTNAWQARGSAELAAPISTAFAITVTAFDDYINNVPSKYRKNYLKLVVGVKFSPPSK